MHDATQRLAPSLVRPQTPAFGGQRWNGWLLLIVAVVGIVGFVITQTAILVLVFFRAHPGVLHSGYIPADVLRQPAIINLLSAKNLFYISVSSELVLLALTLLLARLAFAATPRFLGLGRFPGVQWILFAIAIGILVVFASGIVESLQNKIFGYHQPQFQALVLLKHHGLADFLLDFMAVSIVAPFAEETYFRGLLFTGLVQRIAPMYAAAFSAAFFALAHFEKWSLLPIFVIGLGLAYVYYTTRSLWASMTAHATVNTISLVIAYTLPQLVK